MSGTPPMEWRQCWNLRGFRQHVPVDNEEEEKPSEPAAAATAHFASFVLLFNHF